MRETDVLFKKGMEMLKRGEYRKAEMIFHKAKEIITK